jgi:hypothetical protein
MDEEIPMKKNRFTEAHIMGVMRQAEGGMCPVRHQRRWNSLA